MTALELLAAQRHKELMDDQQLAVALRRQDPLAAQELVRCCGDRLLRSAFLLCGDETEAQDLAQETLVQALRSAHRFRGASSVYSWLYGILLNLTRHYHRDRQRLVGAAELAGFPAPDEGSDRLDARAASAALAAALARLSPPHREVVVLRFYDQLKIHEIGARLGISPGTVKSRLHYAIAQLQQFLPAELSPFGAITETH